MHLFYVYLELQLFLDMFLTDQWVEQCTTKTASARNPSLGNLSVILYYIVLFQFLLYFAWKFLLFFSLLVLMIISAKSLYLVAHIFFQNKVLFLSS